MGPSPPPALEVKLARAGVLIDRYPAAEELLRFYQKLAPVQAGLSVNNTDEFNRFLQTVSGLGNAQVSRNARTLLQSADHRELLDACWQGETADFFARAFLQPFAESLAECPWCRKRPQVSVLRDAAQGARRSLVCGLCSREWNYPRVQCWHCQNQDFDTLPVFASEQDQRVRVEGCDACQSYLISIDMTKDALAVPVVDELAAVSMNVWAQEQGYARRLPNLLGV